MLGNQSLLILILPLTAIEAQYLLGSTTCTGPQQYNSCISNSSRHYKLQNIPATDIFSPLSHLLFSLDTTQHNIAIQQQFHFFEPLQILIGFTAIQQLHFQQQQIPYIYYKLQITNYKLQNIPAAVVGCDISSPLSHLLFPLD